MRVIQGTEAALAAFAERTSSERHSELQRAVSDIVELVRRDGDRAVRELTARFDGATLEELAVAPDAMKAAIGQLEPDLREAIELAIERVRSFYRRQPTGGFLEAANGAVLGVLVRPLERVACYVPGGTAPLFSSLVMTAVPAQVAGVAEVVAATPPRPDGSVAPEILATAALLGLSKLYRVGGAQAIAALAYGTESIEKVDKIVGPGNRFVTAAKQQVFGAVGIEALPGPTETLILADDHAAAVHVVADLLAQAEHEGAQPLLVTPSRRLADEVLATLPGALAELPTAATARASLRERGMIVVVEDLLAAVDLANRYAPEHLCLLVADPWSVVPLVRHAGGIFVGENSMEALGDYLLGPSHVMPTSGTARFSSFVNVRDFQKLIPVAGVTPQLLAEVGAPAARLARAEGLEAHARAIEARLAAVDEV